MTPIFFLVMYFIGCCMTLFKHPIYGIYTYLFTFYMSPLHVWWGSQVPHIRYLLIIGTLTFLVSFRKQEVEHWPPFMAYPVTKLLVFLAVWMWIQYLWVLDPGKHVEGAINFTKHILVLYLIYKFINTKERVITFLLAHIVGCFWFGYQALGKSGGRLESVGGPVGGANELGIHILTAMITGGVLWLVLKDRRKWIIFACMPFVANTLVLTVSRGAFLGFFAAGIIGLMFIPKSYKGKYVGLGVLGFFLIILLAHDALFERITSTFEAVTSDEQELDGSASSRFDIFEAGIQMGLDYPLGAGYRATRILSPSYMPSDVLERRTGGRSAHNTFAGLFAEQGFVGAFVYVAIIFWIIGQLLRLSRQKYSRLDDDDRAISVSIVAAIAGMWVSGVFTNILFTETQYWLFALLCSQLARNSVATKMGDAKRRVAY